MRTTTQTRPLFAIASRAVTKALRSELRDLVVGEQLLELIAYVGKVAGKVISPLWPQFPNRLLTSSRRASFTPRLVPSLVRKRHIFTKSVGDLDRPAGFAAGQSGIGLSLLSGGGISVANSTPDPLGIDLQALEVALRGFFLTQRGGASPAPPRTTAKKRVGVIGPEVLWQKPWGS